LTGFPKIEKSIRKSKVNSKLLTQEKGAPLKKRRAFFRITFVLLFLFILILF